MDKKFLGVVVFLSIFLILFSFFPINLPTADIGRHVKNGELILHGKEAHVAIGQILHTNLFSYTYPNFSFTNHHYGSGVIAYLLFSIIGWSGLSIIYFLLILLTLLILLFTVRHDASTESILFTGIFLIPFLASRTEIRPEGVSFLFIALFISILFSYSKKRIPAKTLLVLPLIEIFWANLHIYFIFGPFLIGVFLIEELINQNWVRVKNIFITLSMSVFAMCITPFFVKGALYPFLIFKNYGYRIIENQSIGFLEKISLVNPEFWWYKIALFIFLINSIFVFIKDRKNFPVGIFICTCVFGILGYISIRNIPLFAISALICLPIYFTFVKKYLEKSVKEYEQEMKIFNMVFSIFIFVGFAIFNFSEKMPWNRPFTIGVPKTQLTSINFIKENNIHGPFFNNYDIGGFMILGLYPKEKVFVDNRPEAYPKEFFENTYIPMQEKEEKWQEELKKNKFNAIYFYRLDYTPWAQTFLISRVKDPAWAPVFVDNKTILFLYRNEINSNIIKKYEIPKEVFNVN
jgi:hypothetical protein